MALPSVSQTERHLIGRTPLTESKHITAINLVKKVALACLLFFASFPFFPMLARGVIGASFTWGCYEGFRFTSNTINLIQKEPGGFDKSGSFELLSTGAPLIHFFGKRRASEVQRTATADAKHAVSWRSFFKTKVCSTQHLNNFRRLDKDECLVLGLSKIAQLAFIAVGCIFASAWLLPSLAARVIVLLPFTIFARDIYQICNNAEKDRYLLDYQEEPDEESLVRVTDKTFILPVISSVLAFLKGIKS